MKRLRVIVPAAIVVLLALLALWWSLAPAGQTH
jgi:nitrogen fixation-related uncharacterized protein